MPEVTTISSRLRDVEQSIKKQPAKALAIAAMAGFVVGGGYRSRLGISLLGLAGRSALRNLAMSALLRANKNRSGRDREPELEKIGAR
jgi:hypothetical protein